jgi:hypothetical protein
MGRHSAPDEDEDGDVLVAQPDVLDPSQLGRHARTEDDSERDAAPLEVPLADQETERLVPPDAEPPGEPTVEVAAPQPGDELTADPSIQPLTPRVGKGNQSTAADLELLRAHSDLRARVIAAIVAPFVIYTLAMYLGGALDVYFIWVWLPLVTAGVLAGSILDAAHRKRSKGAGSG